MSKTFDDEFDRQETDSSTDFETVLRSLRPSEHTRLCSEETFYQAGWQAALVSQRTAVKPQQSARQRVSWFSSGIVAGLVSAGLLMAVWNARPGHGVSDAPERVAERETSPSDHSIETNEPMPQTVADAADSAVEAAANDPVSFTSNVFPWTWPEPFDRPAFAMADGPLSTAAEHQWGDLLDDVTDRHFQERRPGASTKAWSAEGHESLRPSSARQWLESGLL